MNLSTNESITINLNQIKMKLNKTFYRSIVYFFILSTLHSCKNQNLTVSISSESNASQVRHGIQQLEKLKEKGIIEGLSQALQT